MHTKNFLFIVIVFCAIDSFGQNNFKFSPEKPKAGEIINITYTPSGDIANATTPIEAIVYALGSKGQKINDMSLKKSGNEYTTVISTDTSDNFVFFSFSSDKKFDNNYNNGYWIQLYNGD